MHPLVYLSDKPRPHTRQAQAARLFWSVTLANFAQRRLSRCDCPAISGGLLYEPRSVSQRSCEDAAQRSMGQDLSGTELRATLFLPVFLYCGTTTGLQI